MSVDPPNVAQLLATALAHHQSGRLAQAEPGYRQVLSLQPDQPDALHYLGVLYHQAGKTAQGAELIARAVAAAPTFANLSNFGEVLRVLGRHNDSVAALRKSIELNPNHPDSYSNLGLAMMDLGQFDQAEQCFQRAAHLAPQRVDLQLRLAAARQKQGDPYGAVLAARRATELAPNMPQAWSNLAVSLAGARKHDEALHAARQCVALAPNHPEAHINLGIVHERADRLAPAEGAYRKAIEVDPNYGLAHRNLAALLDRTDRLEQSIESLERSLQLQTNDFEGWNNLSSLRRRARDLRGSLDAADMALQLRPGDPMAHGSRGLALLALGDYEQGFTEYEWRWRCDNFTTKPRDFDRAMWDGSSDPTGRTIFFHAEQGYGDTLQFVRYIPMLAARGATVWLESSIPLRPLLASVKGVAKIVPAGVRPPDFDLHVPLLSLPKIFRTTLQTVPAEVPYLSVDSQRLDSWKQRIDAAVNGFKVGLVWAGNVKPDAARTCPLSNLAPLGQIEGVRLVSLQKRENPQGGESPPPGMSLLDVSDDLKDFADTAAAMMNLDLIITIDTAAAHLAGALARPTWTLLPWAGDWRWLEDREDSPWYPTMRLFRQPTKGDWTSVANRVAEELKKLVTRDG
jgi:tetratricopeptide (TPR) repeat protein